MKKLFCLMLVIGGLMVVSPAYADIYLRVKNGEISLTNNPDEEGYVLVYSHAGEEGRRFEGPADLQRTIERASNKHRLPESLIFAVMTAVENVELEAENIMGLPSGLRDEMTDTQARDEWYNIDRGTARLREKLGYFEGNLTLALGAYFSSSERVEETGGIPPEPHVRQLVERTRENFEEYRARSRTILTFEDKQGVLNIITVH